MSAQLITTGLGLIASGLAYVVGKDVQQTMKDYPPVSDAPEFGSIVKMPKGDGTTEDYVVVTSTGQSVESAKKMEEKLKNKRMNWNIYHTRNQSYTQFYARRDKGPVVYLGLPANTKEYKEPENQTYFDLPGPARERFEDLQFVPLDGEKMNKYNYKVVHMQEMNMANDVRVRGCYQRRWAAEEAAKTQKN